jgi:hypothetical protein
MPLANLTEVPVQPLSVHWFSVGYPERVLVVLLFDMKMRRGMLISKYLYLEAIAEADKELDVIRRRIVQ